MEKRLIVAVVLSVLVILIFQVLFPQPKKAYSPVAKPAATPPAVAPFEDTIKQEPAVHELQREKETIVETEKYILTFSNLGGALKNVALKEYKGANTDAPLELVSGEAGGKAILSMKSNTLINGLDERAFKLMNQGRNRITYEYAVAGKFAILKEYHLYNSSDYIELRISIKNLGNDPIYKDYDILGASNLKSTSHVMGRRFLEIDSMVNGKILRNTRIKNGEMFVKGIISWTGVKERYFSIILKPQQESDGVILKQFANSKLASGIRTKRAVIYPGTKVEDSYILYIGPNSIQRLHKLGFGFEQILNYGVFGGISKFLLAILRVFHKGVKNWGVAIIMLTFIINIVLFPLTRKSFLSMRKIQEVQPHIEKLRTLHKDNPQKLNKELAELYRQYNVNPFGGCLPLLIQMPIFIALYQGLIRSIELKGANFLWIKDLSSPDYVNLPVTLPILGNQLHVLPLIMVAAMFFQQRISTMGASAVSKEQQQQQKFMMIFFPLFFGFLFYNFPSGLVLYWLTNTILMVLEQSSMKRSLARS